MEAFDIARTNMVKSQILPNRVLNNNVIETIQNTPRHIFVPDNKEKIAYIDSFIPLDTNRYLLPPMVFAKMLEVIDIKGNENVLDVACGTGYSSVILANLCKNVVAVESNTTLASQAHLNLNKLGIQNVIIIGNELKDGHEESSPYDIIFINGAIKEQPGSLLNQLSENGRLVTIISKGDNYGAIILYKKNKLGIEKEEVFEVNLPVIEDF